MSFLGSSPLFLTYSASVSKQVALGGGLSRQLPPLEGTRIPHRKMSWYSLAISPCLIVRRHRPPALLGILPNSRRVNAPASTDQHKLRIQGHSPFLQHVLGCESAISLRLTPFHDGRLYGTGCGGRGPLCCGRPDDLSTTRRQHVGHTR